jgi:MerR family transcriptional regulator, repressor of the yfmOP operon
VSDPSPGPVWLRIGEMAERAGVSPRTVRYYEQVGLLDPTSRSPGGTRRYDERDLARLLRIRELQSLMGFDLDQIRTIVAAEDRLDELRAAYGEALPLDQRNQILVEAMGINRQLRAEVEAKLARLGDFLADLDRKAVRYRQVADERQLRVAPYDPAG